VTQTAVLDRRDGVDLVAAVLMVGLTLSWGLNGVAAKLAYPGYSPLFVNIARAVIGGALVLLWCRYRGIPVFARDGTLWLGMLAGGLFGAEFIFIFVGLEYTSVARSTLMINTMPFWVLIGAHFLLGERMSVSKFVGLALAFCGVVLVFSDKLSHTGPSTLVGDLMSLAGGMLWGATTLVIKASRLRTAGAEKLLLYQLVMSILLALPLLLIAGPAIRDPSLGSTGALLFQAIYVVGITYMLWFWLMRRYPATGLSSFVFLTPVFGVLCGGLILGEPLSMHIVIALGLIAAGLVIVNRPLPKTA
jgi:drug/metabolite transporter (DMT)-like permease